MPSVPGFDAGAIAIANFHNVPIGSGPFPVNFPGPPVGPGDCGYFGSGRVVRFGAILKAAPVVLKGIFDFVESRNPRELVMALVAGGTAVVGAYSRATGLHLVVIDQIHALRVDLVNHDAAWKGSFLEAVGRLGPTESEIIDRLRPRLAESEIKRALSELDKDKLIVKRHDRW